jgi:hypothetical protein
VRHLTALQITIDDVTGWHYVSASRRGGYPLGYCAEHSPHPTEVEARECYARWQRDHVRLDGRCSWTSCSRCPNPANRYAYVEGDGYTSAALCDQHLTLEPAVQAMHLDGPAGDAWQS